MWRSGDLLIARTRALAGKTDRVHEKTDSGAATMIVQDTVQDKAATSAIPSPKARIITEALTSHHTDRTRDDHLWIRGTDAAIRRALDTTITTVELRVIHTIHLSDHAARWLITGILRTSLPDEIHNAFTKFNAGSNIVRAFFYLFLSAAILNIS